MTLSQINEMHGYGDTNTPTPAGNLRIGLDGSLMTGAVPMLLRLLQAEFPLLHWSLHDANSAQQYDALCRGEIDVAIWRGMPADAEGLSRHRLQQQLYCREEISVALPKGHRLARRNSIALSDLKDEPLLTSPAMFTRSSTLMAMMMVGTGVGGALVPRSAASITFPNVTVRRLREAPSTSVYLAYGIDTPHAGMQPFFDAINRERGSRPFCVSSQ